MSTNKMLIDASHPEETRVAIVRGNKIEEYDFESQERKQLRGNIYLAKVTRVEPSLQAAFVDYGGNRHGFLAFSEIHADYYQIPVADRQALIEAEAAEARASREEDEAEDETNDQASTKPERPKRRSRKAKTEKPAETSADEAPSDTQEDETSKITESQHSDDDNSADDAQSGEAGDDTPSGTMSAMVETDTISEPLPGDDSPDEDGEDSGDGSEEPIKRKRRTTRRKPAKAKTIEAEEEVVEAVDAVEGKADEIEEVSEVKKPKSESKSKSAKPKTRSKAKAKAKDKSEISDDSVSGSADENDNEVESIGREDAMEEVPVRRKSHRQYKIQEVIKRRQVLLIQIVKEERGTKGAALTTYLSLAGRYSVLMPNTARGGGISRKITNANDRKRLKTIATDLSVPDGMGVILRTAGASRTKAEIKRDFEYLMRLWEQVRSLTLSSSAPCLVYEEGSLIKRSIRDLYDKDIGEILVAGEAGYREAKEFMGMLMPSHAKHVKPYSEPQTIFSKFGVEAHLDRMLSPQVTLKSGGYLIINQTEALVAIDVNSGRSTREHSIEATALKTNLEASEEVARQLRLRDLAGLIVIDYIDMEERRNNRAVEKKLKDSLKDDRARIQIGRISHFGLMEMSRQRIRASVLESTMDVCPHCGGQGYVRSNSAIALHIFRAIEEHLIRHHRFDAIVTTTPRIAIHLLNHKRASLMELETRYGLQIIIKGGSNIVGQEFKIEKGEPARGDPADASISYQNTDIADEAADGGKAEEKSNSRNRRGRGRRGEAQDDNAASIIADEATPQETASPSGEEDDDSAPRKKRRRGRRGGRRNRAQKQGGDETGSESSPGTTASESINADAPDVDVTPDQPAPEPEASEKPKPRSRRRKKTDPQTPDQDIAASDPVVEPEIAEPSIKTRNTRRPRNTDKAEKPAEPDQATTQAVEIEADTKSEKPKKGGWWRTGGGFF